MQVYERKYIEMTRDMDLIRAVLLAIEGNPACDGRHWVTLDPGQFKPHAIDEINYHVQLLIEARFVEGNVGPVVPTISKLTWRGHEFLDNTRDQDIWSKTKERIKGLASVALSVAAEIAQAEVKKRLGLP